MPSAVVNPNNTQRHDLKTLEGAYVVLRPMSYDAYLERRDMTTQIRLAGSKGKGKGGGDSEFAGELAMMNRKVAAFEFAQCIVDHNLTDDNDEPLDFSKSYTLKTLMPKVGQEIGDLIDEMNQYLEDGEQGN